MERNEPSGASDGPFGDWIDENPSENARLLAESMDELLNEGRVSAVDKYHSDDLRYFRSSNEPGGKEELKADVRMFLRAFDELTATIEDAFADSEDENVVTIRYEIAGTHSEVYETISPTKQEVQTYGIGIAEFEDGEIVELSVVFDNLGLLQNGGILD